MSAAIAGTPTKTGVSSGNSITIAKPSGVSDGDLLVAILRGSSSGATADFSLSGWTRAHPNFQASNGTSRIMGIYYKAIPSASSETATSYTFTYTGAAGRIAGQIFRVTGVDLSSPIQTATADADYATPTITNGVRMRALSPAAAGLMIVLGANEVTSPNADALVSLQSGFTNDGLAESTTGTGATRTVAQLAHKSVSSGSTGTVDMVWAATSSAAAFGVVFKDASASPPTAAFSITSTDYLDVAVDGTASTAVSPATISSYDWDWGDGTPHGSGSTATHQYRDAGTYAIKLTVTDSNALTGNVSHNATPTRYPGLRLGTTEVTRLFKGESEVVAVYKGSTLVRQFSHTIEEIFADTNLFVAHRGFSQTFPQSTMYAYDQCFAWGMKAIEISVWPSSDGTFWCSHDQNLLATTGHNVDITATSDATLATYNILGSTASDNPSQPDRPMTKLQDVLDKYGTRMVIFVEDKTYSHAAQLVPILQTVPDYQHHIIWKQDITGNPFSQPIAAGIKTWGYLFADEMGSFASQQSKVDYFGLDFNCDDATCASAITTAGASRVIAHIIGSQAQATRMLGKGVKGLMCATRSIAPANLVL